MDVVFCAKIPYGKLKGRVITEYGDVFREDGKGFIKSRKRTDGLAKITHNRQSEFVHLSVARLFVPNPNNFDFVLHIDGNVQNNHKDNLKWSKTQDSDWEEYKQIPGFSKYKISREGIVKSYFNKYFPKIRSTFIDENGYALVSLMKDSGKSITIHIHRLLAITYLENPENLPEVDHVDRNRSNNHLSNLRWASLKMQAQNRSSCPNIKKICQYSLNGMYLRTHLSVTDATKYIGKSTTQGQAIRKCANKNKRGNGYSSFGFIWLFETEDKLSYKLQKGEIAKKIVGSFDNISFYFPKHFITNFGTVISSKGISMGLKNSDVCPSVTLQWNNKEKTIAVHILVALFFVGGRTKEKRIVDHLDENRINARFDNLEWVTYSENSQRCSHKKWRSVNKINKETGNIETFRSLKDAAKSVQGTSTGIIACCKGVQKTAYGFKWAYN